MLERGRDLTSVWPLVANLCAGIFTEKGLPYPSRWR
jgi:hypothetical protein